MIESQSALTSFLYCACFLMSYLSKSFLAKFLNKASESFLSEFFLPKLFGPKVFNFNVNFWEWQNVFYSKELVQGLVLLKFLFCLLKVFVVRIWW